ncbi:MAG: class C sortase [Lachnospiraceae bacterium]|nr:class C sortase [Lachnospiraceae bacterium]
MARERKLRIQSHLRKQTETGKTFLGILVIAFGIGIYLYPDIREWELEWRTNRLIAEFEEYDRDETEKEGTNADDGWQGYENGEENGEEIEKEKYEDQESADEQRQFAELYRSMQEYNEKLAENGQKLVDAWSYAQEPIDLDGITTEDGAVGYIRIPAMDVTLPLYIGATTENLSKGAAVLSETSMPIGGESTNCVIAGHRGYSGMPYFREIEKLKEQDAVYVTNPWETMTYTVEEIRIVSPDDVESVLIVPGKDQITLLTCHPYMSHGKYRYLVICRRADGTGETADDDSDEAGADWTDASAAAGMELSKTDEPDAGQEEGAAGFAAALLGCESISELRMIIEKALRFLFPAMALDLFAVCHLRKRTLRKRNS